MKDTLEQYLIHCVIISAAVCAFLIFQSYMLILLTGCSNTCQYFPICRCWPWLQLLMTLIILRKQRLITLWMLHMFFQHVGRSVYLFKNS